MKYGMSFSPCIVISVAAGPYFRISGEVFVEVFTVQNFTDLGREPFRGETLID